MVHSKHDGDDDSEGIDAWRDEMPTIPRHSGWVEQTSTHVNIEKTWKYIHVATVFVQK